MKNLCKKYCSGCGLCVSENITELNKNEKGFYYPQNFSKTMLNICPCYGKHTQFLSKTNIWGNFKNIYLGWSKDEKVRFISSSGGMLTEISSFLIESKIVDSIIHIGESPKDPTETQVFFSSSRAEIISHSGSRYAISSPLSIISKLDKNKKYCLIGKPCDISAFKNYASLKTELKEIIPITLSFFCMGVPSSKAQKRLLEKMKCSSCKHLVYRGNGWPGYAVATDNNKTKQMISYDESWGKILGRDLMPLCRFCVDGIGEMADISCGDAWYINSENKPDFTEHNGRNVVFARSDVGDRILNKMAKNNLVHLESYERYLYELPIIQTSQFKRRCEMRSRLLAMKILFHSAPHCDKTLLKNMNKQLTIKNKIRVILGMIKRCLKGKI